MISRTIKRMGWVGLLSILSLPAQAQIAEIRVGVSEFDERILDVGIAAQRANENSVALNAEILFEEPEFLKWAFTPQPYINATLNLEGETSYGGAGLLWRQTFGKKFYGDFSFGLVVHTGTNSINIPAGGLDFGTPAGQQAAGAFFDRFDNEIQLGSRVLFREQIALGYNLNDDWSAEVFFEHLSNGTILARINSGVDIVGVRAVKKF